MVRGALLHLPGIGSIREARLRALGARGWADLGPQPPPGLRLSPASWAVLLEEVARCDAAFASGDIGFFARTLCGPDLWRVLAAYSQRAAYVDIETDGLGFAARITVIACLWKGRLYTYVQGENLDEFLDLLQHLELMVTFNGASFDVPMILRGFHIPELPCAHVDLRRVCYHAGRRGGLKAVEAQLGLQRPPDLVGVDGAQAVEMWLRWQRQQSRFDRDLLVRYCAADAVALRGVAEALLRGLGCGGALPPGDGTWDELNEAIPPPIPPQRTAGVAVAESAKVAAPRPAVSSAGGAAVVSGVPAATAEAVPPARPGEVPADAARRRLRELLRRRFAQGAAPPVDR
jgi:hypothetical protein